MTPQVFPLSSGQERLWLLDQLRPESTAYTVPVCWRVHGEVDPAALRRAVVGLVARHEVLRTRYVTENGDPGQVIDAVADPEWATVDLAGVPEGERETRWAQLVDGVVERPFRLATEWPLRARLFRWSAGEHVLLLVLHHIACDGWSQDVLARDLGELYRAEITGDEVELPDLPVQYADFAAWQRASLTKQSLARDLEYWREALDGLRPVDLPTDKRRPPQWHPDGGTTTFTVPPRVGRAVAELAREARATPYMTLLTAFLALLSRWTGRTDLAVGTPFAGRNRPEVQDLIGHFVNTVVIRAELGAGASFRTALDRVRRACLSAYAHQELPFERLVAALAPDREPSRNPLFEIMFSVASGERGSLELTGAVTRPEFIPDTSPMFDLSVELTEQPDGGLTGLVTYACSLFTPATVNRFVDGFGRLLAAAVAAPETTLGELDVLGEEVRRRVLSQWNDTAVARPEIGIAELVGRQVERTPDAPAVLGDGGTLNYAELDRRANGLARRLSALGAGPDSPVGLCLPRGPDLVVALLGVLKAGAAYVPLDPDGPAARTALVLADAGVRLVLARRGTEPPPGGVAVLDPRGVQPEGTPPAPRTGPDDLLYVLYTSGSTGVPKGALVTHRGMVNRVLWAAAQHLGPADRVLCKTPLTFDAAGWEIWAPLAVGGTVVLAEPGAEQDPSALVRAIRAHDATVLQVVPSMLRLLVDEPGFAECASLRSVFAGGEPLTAELAERVTNLLDVELYNLYGPTECTIDATAWRYRRGERPAIGSPIHNVSAYVLDAEDRPVPVGVPGELHIGGVGLAWGYLGRPALTAATFVPNPFGPPGSRLYRSGDRARWRPDGNLEFLGREDDQVKVGGVRVELGEVSAALAAHPRVTGAAVQVHTDHFGDSYLVAHYEPDTVTPADLREFAGTRLPAAMVPARLLPAQRLPRTASGKVDRRSLTPPAAGNGDAEASVEPRTPIECQVAEIVADALGLSAIGLHDDFFRLGGHSLLAIRTASRLRAELAVDVPVRLLFSRPTVARIVRALQTPTGEAAIPPAPPGVPLPASSGQRRIWFLDRLRPGLPEYLVGYATRLRGPLDTAALADAVGALADRHDVLRTRCGLEAGRLVQVVEPSGRLVVDTVDLGLDRSTEAERSTAVTEFAVRTAGRPFRLAAEPPLRAVLARVADDDHVLVLALHHIACDARSIEIMAGELGPLYAGDRPPPPPVRFADFASWERTWLASDEAAAQLAFWRARLDGLVPLELPADRSRPSVHDAAGGVVEFELPASWSAALIRIGRDEGATPFVTMLAAFDILLMGWCGREDVAIGTTVTGRPHPSVEDLVGPFTNSVVLRADLTGCRDVIDVLRRVSDGARTAFAHQDLPFERLVEQLRPQRDLGRNPLFGIQFELEPHSDVTPRLPGIRAEEVPVHLPVAKLDLRLHLAERADGSYTAIMEYATALFDHGTVRRLADDFRAVVAEISANPRGPLPRLGARHTAEQPRVSCLADEEEHSPPESATERKLAALWAELLEVSHIGAQDNFFDLGGHSLLAIELQAAVHDDFGVEVPLRAMFEAPTLRALAAVVDTARSGTDTAALPGERAR